MRVLLSTYGSRGDVEPMLGLADQLRAPGAQVQVCAYATFQQLMLPSPHQPPLLYLGRPYPPERADAQSVRAMFSETLNAHRAAIGHPWQAQFARVAAVMHHGGAGTTTTAAMAGTPQVVIPQAADQPYWAGRVAELGIGAAHRGPRRRGEGRRETCT